VKQVVAFGERRHRITGTVSDKRWRAEIAEQVGDIDIIEYLASDYLPGDRGYSRKDGNVELVSGLV
jgi:hypothetical protein